MSRDEDLLLELLNSTPVVDGRPTDTLVPGADTASTTDDTGPGSFARRHGGTGSAAELETLRRTRDHLQGVVRGAEVAQEHLAASVSSISLRPVVTASGIDWELDAPADAHLAARAVLAWSRVLEDSPGRLRPCANSECALFLIDHSRPGTARWCSMATCGNRMKARAHAARHQGAGRD